MATDRFSAQYERIRQVLGVRTQAEVAAHLGIRQSSISDAKRRNVLPDAWKIKLLRRHGVNPLWVETGEGASSLEFTRQDPAAATARLLANIPTADIVSELGRRFPAGARACARRSGGES